MYLRGYLCRGCDCRSKRETHKIIEGKCRDLSSKRDAPSTHIQKSEQELEIILSLAETAMQRAAGASFQLVELLCSQSDLLLFL